MSTSIDFYTFNDLLSIIQTRAKIAGEVQTEDLDFIKGAINEHYINICTERNWTWRKFDRSFAFKAPLSTGTVSVVNGSRVATFTGLTISDFHRTRSLQITGTLEIYRIIGVDVSANSVYLDAPYIQTTNAVATFKMYQYEFALPPDCDTVSQVYVDGNLLRDRQIDDINNAEFNRFLSSTTLLAGPPQFYTQDGMIAFNPTAVPLDVQLLDYDFLGGEDFDEVFKLRIFPIWPDQDRIIHINYSLMVEPMTALTDKPIIPVDDRSVLIHFALYEWWKTNGNMQLADRELRDGNKKLQEMRDEHRKTDIKPTFIMDGTRYRRARTLDRNIDLFRVSRLNETL